MLAVWFGLMQVCWIQQTLLRELASLIIFVIFCDDACSMIWFDAVHDIPHRKRGRWFSNVILSKSNNKGPLAEHISTVQNFSPRYFSKETSKPCVLFDTKEVRWTRTKKAHPHHVTVNEFHVSASKFVIKLKLCWFARLL